MKIKIAGINRSENPLPTALPLGSPPDLSGTGLQYHAEKNNGLLPDEESGALFIDSWSFEDLFDLCGMDEGDREAFGDSGALAIQCGGWQSWSAGWELAGRDTLPVKVRFIPELLKLTNREGDTLWFPPPALVAPSPESGADPEKAGVPAVPDPSARHEPAEKDWLVGHFITYIRSGDRYLCIASREGGVLPPVSYHINRGRRRIIAEVFCPGKTWAAQEDMAELWVFFARAYFPFKDTLRALYGQEKTFRSVSFLRAEAPFPPGPPEEQTSGAESPQAVRGGPFPGKAHLPGGYESWYNHYTDINEKLILEDLRGLGKTENLIKLRYQDRRKPAVFQIDDGWEMAVGEWEIDTRRFPRGLAPVAAEIAAAGYIPGLWLAPFLVTRGSRIFTERPGWLLREKPDKPPMTAPERRGGKTRQPVTEDRPGRLVRAGFNPNWSGPYYCLDLSRKDVLEYLRGILDRVIDEWGFRYLKLDFLYAGLLSGAFAGGGSPYEHYERACLVLTGRDKTAGGLPVAYLGCGLPLGPSYRHFPLSRIGADTREEWEWKPAKLLGHVGTPGAYTSLADTIGRSFMDGTVYINDPDVIFLRSRNCKLTENEKELIALTDFLLGGQIMFSDDPLHLEDADIGLTKRIAALYGKLEDDEYGATRLLRDVFRLESRSARVAGLINLSRSPFVLDRDGGPGVKNREDRRLAAELYGALAEGRFLTDHRLKPSVPGSMVFAPHTITISTS
ncbi:MAG: alpha-galactosidase [Spirochaetaceae bacterium]|jgi:alpha-galactosidase|nr:alpha-galactosidase [Spirochaetaceae bacterium]